MRRKSGSACRYHHHIHFQAYQFRRQFGKPLALAFGKTPFDQQVLAFDITTLAQPAPKTIKDVGVEGSRARRRCQETDAPNLALLFRKRIERRDQRARAKRCDKSAASFLVHFWSLQEPEFAMCVKRS